MTTQMIIAQCLMVLTLVIMITGMTPIYITAITGAAISAIVAGFPLAGSAPMTIAKMINSGLNPVIADMTGILLFIGIMQATGFLDVIVRDIIIKVACGKTHTCPYNFYDGTLPLYRYNKCLQSLFIKIFAR